MRGDRMPARVLAMRLIPRVDTGLRDRLGLGAEVHALGLITCDSDDVGYTALDEASACAAGCPFVHAAYGFGSAVAPLASIQAPSGLQAGLAAL